MGFTFRGEISSSKSLFNRALIIQAFESKVQIHGLSQSEDVLHLQKALKMFKAGDKEFFCGDGGTTFRFLALRLSREVGEFKIKGSPQLFSRPMKGLLEFFDQVGVKHEMGREVLTISGSGWKIPREVECTANQSSQFATAIILSSWDLDKELVINLPINLPSLSYLDMTVRMMMELGADIKVRRGSSFLGPAITVRAKQHPAAQAFRIEKDMSSLFALAACAIMDGEIEIANVPMKSWQPDAVFLQCLNKMKIEYVLNEKVFYIKKQEKYKSVDIDLIDSPDLFPVLAVLSCRSQGVSSFRGLHTLRYKESDRYKNTVNLIHRLGRRMEEGVDTLSVHGLSQTFNLEGDFDPDGDHRMAMAAQVANLGGAKLKITDKSVVAKSFPEFWAILGEDEE